MATKQATECIACDLWQSTGTKLNIINKKFLFYKNLNIELPNDIKYRFRINFCGNGTKLNYYNRFPSFVQG